MAKKDTIEERWERGTVIVLCLTFGVFITFLVWNYIT